MMITTDCSTCAECIALLDELHSSLEHGALCVPVTYSPNFLRWKIANNVVLYM